MATVGHVARRGDGDALFEGVEPANTPEFALEEGTRLFQDPDVGLAVFQQFGLQVEHAIRRHLLRVPLAIEKDFDDGLFLLGHGSRLVGGAGGVFAFGAST